MIEIDVSKCTNNANTCPAVQQALELDGFAGVVADIYPNSERTRRVLGNFVTARVNGTCPGQMPELTEYLLRRYRSQD